ncbi:MAG: DUF1311 domain-containing protein [Candidatus Gastranaerophilales bacterium]|nr:DUF1311 domain-containing protein [Candidatus Gastranaerophilales bacterium]
MDKLFAALLIFSLILNGFLSFSVYKLSHTEKTTEPAKQEQPLPVVSLIEQNEKICIDNAQNAADVRNCVYTATDEWFNEINKYLELLKTAATPEQFKLIQDSQKLWVEQSDKDNKIINEFVFNHGGTMYFDLAASDYEEIVETRAKFLKWIYDVHTDNLHNNSD